MITKIEIRLMKLLKKAEKHNEVPVGAIITYDGKIIAESYNKREKKYDVLGHAEILCIKKAAKKMKTWKLNNCTLYVSLKPCSMCKKIIQESRIKKVIYYIDKQENKKEYNNTLFMKEKNDNIGKMIKNEMNMFFKTKRKKTNVR